MSDIFSLTITLISCLFSLALLAGVGYGIYYAYEKGYFNNLSSLESDLQNLSVGQFSLTSIEDVSVTFGLPVLTTYQTITFTVQLTANLATVMNQTYNLATQVVPQRITYTGLSPSTSYLLNITVGASNIPLWNVQFETASVPSIGTMPYPLIINTLTRTSLGITYNGVPNLTNISGYTTPQFACVSQASLATGFPTLETQSLPQQWTSLTPNTVYSLLVVYGPTLGTSFVMSSYFVPIIVTFTTPS